ncbi:MAG: hypothetical protein WCE53_12200 [Candidatus Acidiferrum sp.]
MALNTNLTATAKKKSAGANDIFEKCRAFTRPGELQKAGLYMYFEAFGDRDGCQPGEVRLGSSKELMFGSNNYLDLITHPQVKEAAVQAIRKYGSGCSGSLCLSYAPRFEAHRRGKCLINASALPDARCR